MLHKCSLFDKESVNKINSFLLREDCSLLYLSIDYILLLENYLQNIEVELWILNDTNENVIAYFPLVFRLNEQFGTVCNSLPFYGSNGGIIVSSKISKNEKDEARKKLLDAALQSIKEKKCVASTFITNPLDADFNSWISTNLNYQLTDERIGQLTPLPQNIGQNELALTLMNLFEEPRPRNIRKAIKESINVYESYEQEAFNFLYDTHYHNITSINGIPKEKRFFECVNELMFK